MPSAARLVDLQDRIRRIERDGAARHGVLPFGIAAIDRALPGGGLALGAVHEILGAGADEEDGAAAAGFIAGIAGRLGPELDGGLVLWCLKRGDLYGPGLAAHGLDPARIVTVRAARDDDLLWALEEGLRAPASSGGVAAVVGEIGRLPMVAGRRLQLAAERCGIPAFLLRRWRTGGEAAAERARPSAAVTRWRIASLPSSPEAGEPGPLGVIGRPRWRVELLRCRGAEAADLSWDLEVADASGALRLPAELGDRPVAPLRPAAGRTRVAPSRLKISRHSRESGSRASDERSPWTPACAGATKGEGEEQPFATLIAVSGKRLLAAVNPAAAGKGLAAGMPLADALSFLPGLTTRPAAPGEDAAALRRLAEWCGRYSPWTAPDGLDGVKIEITGSAHLWGGEAELAADLSRRLAGQGISHRLAIADTIGAAWATARYAAGDGAPVIVPPEQTHAALAPLPIAALRLDPAIVEGLHRVGLRRVGEVAAMPRDALARRFGETVGRRLDEAFGDLPEPLSPLGEVPNRRVRLSFAEPISDPADLARATERLTQDLVARLAREGMGARRLDLGFHRVDGRVEHISIGTARPSRDPTHLAKLMIGKLDTIDPGLGVEDAILAAFAVEKLPAEQLESPPPSYRRTPPRQAGEGRAGGFTQGPDTASLFDRIGARLGLDALARLEPRASHIPEHASVAVSLAEGAACKKCPRPPTGERAG